MCRVLFFSLIIMFSTYCQAQQLTGTQLLDRAIAYHDPQGRWSTFKGDLNITLERANQASRKSHITIDLYSELFQINTESDQASIMQTVRKDTCLHILNGSTTITDEDINKYKLTDNRLRLLKNYYTYLYGLPMKLKDFGTIIDPVVQDLEFKGKNYKVLTVTYDKNVGIDTWLFYFDPSTYAMEVYQFFKQDPKNDGEYILLSGEETIYGIKMPKNRAWYHNKDDKHLGTDILTR